MEGATRFVTVDCHDLAGDLHPHESVYGVEAPTIRASTITHLQGGDGVPAEKQGQAAMTRVSTAHKDKMRRSSIGQMEIIAKEKVRRSSMGQMDFVANCIAYMIPWTYGAVARK